MRGMALPCLLLPLLAPLSLAEVHHVSPGSSGGISGATAIAASGDIIVLADGIYTGSENRDCLIEDKHIVIRSESGDPSQCIVDCQDGGRGFHFFVTEDDYFTRNALFEGITIRNGSAIDYGGAILVEGPGKPLFLNCVFENCYSGYAGGAVADIYSSYPSYAHCTFLGNHSGTGQYGFGGAIYSGHESTIDVSNCTFIANTAVMRGGAVSCHNRCDGRFENCTFSLNHSPKGAALGHKLYADVQMRNCIIAFNTGGSAVFCQELAESFLSCCDVFGNEGGDWVGCLQGQYGQYGNIQEDPLFCDLSGGDFHLADESPCLPFSSPNPFCNLIGAWGPGCAAADVVEEGMTSRMLWVRAPAPATELATIQFHTPQAGHVEIDLFDATGRFLRTILAEELEAGTHRHQLDLSALGNRAEHAGMFYLRLRAHGEEDSAPLLLVR